MAGGSRIDTGPGDQPIPDEQRLLERLREGDQEAFMELVERHSPTMLRVARMFVPTQAVAEEVVQEAWLGVLEGIGRFEGRSSLRTWIFRILTNRAKTRGERERRTVPFATLAAREAEGNGPAVDPDRFVSEHSGQPGQWAAPPRRWEDSPERSLETREAREKLAGAIAQLPEMQRMVITMRDVEGFGSDEVREALDISEVNQRVLLHRARSKVRNALEDYFDEDL
jgi:RNA polymerase sigma-70 factor, ECF subfamily